MVASLPKTGVQQLSLASIPTDESCQARAKTRNSVVREYAQAMRQQVSEGGLRFPAIVVFTDGEQYWLADGWHRVPAARQAGLTEFPADVRSGTQRDALLFSISANADHGLPRTNADKRKAVTLLLDDPEWRRWNDSEIARRCQVSRVFVGNLRKGASCNDYRIDQRKVQRGNIVYGMRAPSGSARKEASQRDAQPRLASAPDATMSTALTDRVGIPLPAATAPAFASLGVIEAAEKLHGKLAQLVDEYANAPGGAVYRQQLVRRLKDGKPVFASPELTVFAEKLHSAEPHCGYCPRCHAKHPGQISPACKLCGGRGWLTRGDFERCPEHERQGLQRLRPV